MCILWTVYDCLNNFSHETISEFNYFIECQTPLRNLGTCSSSRRFKNEDLELKEICQRKFGIVSSLGCTALVRAMWSGGQGGKPRVAKLDEGSLPVPFFARPLVENVLRLLEDHVTFLPALNWISLLFFVFVLVKRLRYGKVPRSADAPKKFFFGSKEHFLHQQRRRAREKAIHDVQKGCCKGELERNFSSLPENAFENVHLLFQFEFFSFEGLMRFPKVALRDSIFERLRNRSVANGDAFNEVIRVPIDAETIEAALARHPSGGCKARVDLHPRALSFANWTRWLVCY